MLPPAFSTQTWSEPIMWMFSTPGSSTSAWNRPRRNIASKVAWRSAACSSAVHAASRPPVCTFSRICSMIARSMCRQPMACSSLSGRSMRSAVSSACQSTALARSTSTIDQKPVSSVVLLGRAGALCSACGAGSGTAVSGRDSPGSSAESVGDGVVPSGRAR